MLKFWHITMKVKVQIPLRGTLLNHLNFNRPMAKVEQAHFYRAQAERKHIVSCHDKLEPVVFATEPTVILGL